MQTVNQIAEFLEHFAPVELAEDWDNVGLLVGDGRAEVHRVMTCLTITPASAAEAVRRKADLIVTHHPMPFHSLKRLTTETPPGRMLLELISAGVAVYSPHTAFDSADKGINQRLAVGMKLRGIEPLIPDETGLGTGRFGWLDRPLALDELAARAKKFLSIEHMQVVGEADRQIRTLAVACGAAGSLLEAARSHHCDCMLLGETQFHTCLEAQAEGVALLLPGHYASERFAVECLADVLSEEFPKLEIWPSRQEADPLRLV